MANEIKVLQSVLSAFSISYLTAFLVACVLLVLYFTKYEAGKKNMYEDICEEHPAVWAGSSLFYFLIYEQFPIGLLMWYHHRCFKQ